jgi:hypothetical protein
MRYLFALLLTMVGVQSLDARAQAYCALRDPTEQIYSLYPDATTFRSYVGRVDGKVRDEVSQALPFSLHSREIGEHTLYVALRKQERLGLVHVRSEPSDWGIIEIAWSINPDLTINNFMFQRCRGSGCTSVDSERFRALLRGRRAQDLQLMVGTDGSAKQVGGRFESAADERLAATVVRSALKTLAVTKLVWGRELGLKD